MVAFKGSHCDSLYVKLVRYHRDCLAVGLGNRVVMEVSPNCCKTLIEKVKYHYTSTWLLTNEDRPPEVEVHSVDHLDCDHIQFSVMP